MCDFCDESFSLLKTLNDHIKALHTFEPYPCPLCENKILKNKYIFKQHMKRFHSDVKKKTGVKKEIEGELQEGYLCDKTTDKTKTKQQRKSRVKKEQSAEGPTTSLICPECGKEFAHKYRLKKHRRQSAKCTPVDEANCVICEECGKDFVNKYLLGYHMKTTHASEDENKVCQICTKEFKSSVSLKQHLKRSFKCAEGDANSVNCDKCGKEFANEDRLKYHIQRSLKCCPVDEATCVICEECGKQFANKTLLGYHIKIVPPIHSKEQARVCEVCTKEFVSSAKLQQHQRQSRECCQVVGANQVTCPECGKEFANKILLYHHNIDIHVIENVDCPVCGRTYRNRRALGKHIRHSHDGMVKNPYAKRPGLKSLPSTKEVGVVGQSSIIETPPTYPPTMPTWLHPYWPHPLGHTPRQQHLDEPNSWQHSLDLQKSSHVKTEFTEMQTQ